MGIDAEHGRVVSEEPSSKKSCAIIGAGPAGLFAAEKIARAGYRVTVFDRMASPARKFLIAGRGGLNLTHSEPLEKFLTRYSGDADPVIAAIEKFPPAMLIAWANALGAETFIGSSGRVFPKAMKASPLLRAWLKRLNDLGVTFKLRHTWTGWDSLGGLSFRDEDQREVAHNTDATVLALGGASWPRLGSDGSWAGILQSAGISVAALSPSNVGCRISWSDVFRQKFEGHALKRIAVTVGDETRRGEAIVTRRGLEGGVIYALNPILRAELLKSLPAVMTVDLRPDMSTIELAKRLSAPRGKQSASTFLSKTLNFSPAAVGILREGAGATLPTAADDVARLIKSVPLRVADLDGLERAISSAGGLRFDELTGTFMLKKKPGVFAAGEMLDWEAPTGGYLLQAAFATANAAADGAIAHLCHGR